MISCGEEISTGRKKVVTSGWGYINIKFVVLAIAFIFILSSALFALYKSYSFRETEGIFASFTIERRDKGFILLIHPCPTGVFLDAKMDAL